MQITEKNHSGLQMCIHMPKAWGKTPIVLPLSCHQIAFLMSGPWSSLWALEFVPTVEYVASGHNSGITDETPFWALVEVE